MTEPDTAVCSDIVSDEPSLRKQRILSEYTTGKLSCEEVARQIQAIKPPVPKRSLLHNISLFLVVSAFALLIPPWAQRQD